MTFLKLSPEETPLVMSRLMQHPLFSGVPEESLLPMLANGVLRQLCEGEFLLNERDVANAWWLLLEGEMESLRHGLDGEERIFCQFFPHELVAEVLMFVPDGLFPIGIRARSACRLFQMQRGGLHALCEREPKVAIRLLERASQRLCQRIDEVELMARTNGAQRLAGYLLKLHDQQGRVIELPLSQRQLAASLGIRPETLNRLLSEWLQQGYIEGRRRCWSLLAPQSLERIRLARHSGQ